jgi:hypothetical protein
MKGGNVQEFQTGDLEVAAAFYRSIADHVARNVLDYLIDHPDSRHDGAAIVSNLGLARHSDVARATFALGEAAAALGRRRPWREGQMGYTMPADMAELLRQARVTTGAAPE